MKTKICLLYLLNGCYDDDMRNKNIPNKEKKRNSFPFINQHSSPRMASSRNLFLSLYLWLFFPARGHSVDTVLTTRGPVSGTVHLVDIGGPNSLTYLGVPYAQPPIGNRRFQNPIPPEEWQEPVNATHVQSTCLTYDPRRGQVTGDEDCLYLDIYTGQVLLGEKEIPLQDNHWPVLLLLSGGQRMDIQSKPWLMRRIVLIVVHYRLQVLGFLSNDNWGLQDALLALQWVHQNALAFGGDPDHVTLMGAGPSGTHVAKLLSSPQAKGFFSSAAILSAPLGLNESPNMAAKLGWYFNCSSTLNSNDLVECFTKIKARTLVDTPLSTLFGLGVDGKWTCGTTSVHVPMVIGVWEGDGLSPLDFYLRHVLTHAQELEESVKAFYGKANSSEIILDSVYYAPALQFSREHSSHATTYLYELTFNQLSTQMEMSPGVERLLFETPATNADIEERVVRDTLVTLFANFIHSGSPTPPGSSLPPWRPLTSERLQCYELDVGPRMSIDCRRKHQASFWNALHLIDANLITTRAPVTGSTSRAPFNEGSCIGCQVVATLLGLACVGLVIYICLPRMQKGLEGVQWTALTSEMTSQVTARVQRVFGRSQQVPQTTEV